MGKFIEGNEERRLSLELYRKDELFGVYISDNEGGSGITVEEPSPEEAAKEAAKYIADYFVNNDEDEEEREQERFTLLYDGEEGDFSTKYLKNAILVALADYAEGGYEKIEVYDNEKEEVVWTTNSDFEDIKEHLDEWAEGKDIEVVEVYLRTKGAECCDEDIDDGVGNGEYLMYRAYELGEHTIKVYYSSTTHEVTYVQYRDE